ncbi:MAG: GGDEF domain-containing protein [Pseudomonadales bacterium]|nr:GGDEF domain-containing protein [Halieaceae bacterium]MCP5165430.1 GGDEF domain-containing protein [Pseudomonadales bacterium]MCP5190772.1 GGDEF domain-containing protein [Pseudomonadales bacterium]MCP5205109.1 GGDEF domain-containing protein [Pseudomonadales bacterium]
MEQISTNNWAYMHFALIFSITCAQMLVVYTLAESSKPPAGLGLYTVYFMASLLQWIALTLQQNSGVEMGVDLPSVIAILNSYILVMAAGQRVGIPRGRTLLGAVCLAACLSVFFLPRKTMFLIEALAVGVFFATVAGLSGWRCWRQRNVGDGIIASAALLMTLAMPLAGYYVVADSGSARGENLAFAVYTVAYSLIAIGFLASVLIEYQHHLSHLATEDPLTRLLNRRGLEDALQVSMAHARRHDLPTSAIMVDIDHFKQVNDSFSHEIGDHVIRQVAEVISRLCRSSDVVARTGGEEFLVVLPDTELNSARVLAERIREAIGERPLLVDFQRIAVTVSLGVASSNGLVDLDHLTQEADRALYLAKRGGRNRVASVESRRVHLSTANGPGSAS